MIWLVGAGPMAVAYQQVLSAQQVPVRVIGRGESGAAAFTEKTGVPVVTGGLDVFLEGNPALPEAAIVAVNVAGLYDVCLTLLDAGVKRILLEKPGALYQWQCQDLADRARCQNATVVIAYNRRFHASTQVARAAIKADGGATSFDFDITEWAHRIGPSAHPDEVKARWVIANTAHVIDLAFFLGGEPDNLHCMQAGGLDWHPDATVLSGCGSTHDGALFTYHGNWQSAGRWGLTLSTAAQSLQLVPLEALQIQKKGTVSWETAQLDDELDKTYKPGVYAQVAAFLAGNDDDFCDLDKQIQRIALCEKIAGYNDSSIKDGLKCNVR